MLVLGTLFANRVNAGKLSFNSGVKFIGGSIEVFLLKLPLYAPGIYYDAICKVGVESVRESNDHISRLIQYVAALDLDYKIWVRVIMVGLKFRPRVPDSDKKTARGQRSQDPYTETCQAWP
ncbi:hypothetical protein SCAB_53572 [Streptomyces scabiei 87.22]|uniref:Uncharacterized protein n=1 Tax=Streptomyces scabiei (strain 87.22) TaxID=680198 RepID=C9YWK9_STRSW|nr:hypothetical protein SCAB_53572 [Streptomyces scabiei 87.22]